MVDNQERLISETDRLHYDLIRQSVDFLLRQVSDRLPENAMVLDVAPQDHGGIAPFLRSRASVVTLDIDEASGADIIGDICRLNDALPDGLFDVVICTEVLEHVSNPFSAIHELSRVLRPGGLLAASAPFDFRIHGPLPDNWRFTEHGWRALLSRFSRVDIESVINPGRWLMPIHYRVLAVK